MTEKAMVCAYMSILYDGLPTLGEKYLQVILAHSQELAKHLSSQTDKRITGTGMIVCTRQAFARFLSFLRQTKGSQEQAKDLQE